jgi:hypothetical protein
MRTLRKSICVSGEQSGIARAEAESKEKHSVWDPMPESTITHFIS